MSDRQGPLYSYRPDSSTLSLVYRSFYKWWVGKVLLKQLGTGSSIICKKCKNLLTLFTFPNYGCFDEVTDKVLLILHTLLKGKGVGSFFFYRIRKVF